MTYPRHLVERTSVAVAPTPTTLATIYCMGMGTVAIQVTNADAEQLLTCSVWRRASEEMDYAQGATPVELATIQPGATAMADMDPGGATTIQVRGEASGAGLTASVVAVQA